MNRYTESVLEFSYHLVLNCTTLVIKPKITLYCAIMRNCLRLPAT